MSLAHSRLGGGGGGKKKFSVIYQHQILVSQIDSMRSHKWKHVMKHPWRKGIQYIARIQSNKKRVYLISLVVKCVKALQMISSMFCSYLRTQIVPLFVRLVTNLLEWFKDGDLLCQNAENASNRIKESSCLWLWLICYFFPLSFLFAIGQAFLYTHTFSYPFTKFYL